MQTNFAHRGDDLSRVRPASAFTMCRCRHLSAPSTYTGSSFTLFRSNTDAVRFQRCALARRRPPPLDAALMVRGRPMKKLTVEPDLRRPLVFHTYFSAAWLPFLSEF